MAVYSAWMSNKILSKTCLSLVACFYIILPTYWVYSILGRPLTGIDDAMIFFVYARHFADGYGIVYNIAGEHVEGFTSLLYFLICSAFYRFSDHPQWLIFSYHLLMTLLSTLLMLRMLSILSEKANLSFFKRYLIYWLFLAWLFINPLYYHWNVVSFMDISTYTLLLVAAYGYFCFMLCRMTHRDLFLAQIMTSLWIILILLCRPEGMLWGLVYLLNIYGVSLYQQKKVIPAIKAMLLPAVTYGLGLTGLTLFRQYYFGYPLPNTYYAKVSASFSANVIDGIHYLLDFIHLYGIVVFMPCILLMGWSIRQIFLGQEKSIYFYLSLITLTFIGTGLIIPVLEGGDHFNGFRLYQPVYPFLILPFMLCMLIFRTLKIFELCILVFSASVYAVTQAGWAAFRDNNASQITDHRMRVSIEYAVARAGIENGNQLNDIFQEDLPSIGFAAAGGIAYAYKGFVYDVLGLNDTQFAHADTIKTGYKGHQSFDKTVLLNLMPDIFIPLTQSSNTPFNLVTSYQHFTDPNTWDSLIFKNIFNDDSFKKQYILATVENKAHPAYQCQGYFSQQYLAKIRQDPRFKIETWA